MQRIFYLCNGKQEGCRKSNCYTKGGWCRHTEDVKYAKNFEDTSPVAVRQIYYEKETASCCKTVSEN